MNISDFLPSEYRSWSDFYNKIESDAIKNGYELNDDSIIEMFDYLHFDEIQKLEAIYGKDIPTFVTKYPILKIKSNAFHEIRSSLPKYDEMHQIMNAVMISRPSQNVIDSVYRLLDIVRDNGK